MSNRQASRAWVVVIGVCLGLVLFFGSGAFLVGVAAQEKPNPLLPPERELAMKVKGSFTFAAIGDILLRHPTGKLAEPAFQNLIKRLRDADVAFANIEGSVIDYDTFEHPIGAGMPKSLLEDVKAMGIDMVSLANNHTVASAVPGIFETIRQLKSADIVPAGTGRNLQEARAPAFVNTPRGVMGLVAGMSIAFPEYQERFAADIEEVEAPRPFLSSGATYQQGMRGGEPGLNPLHLKPVFTIDADAMAAMRKTRDAILAHRTKVPGGVHPPKEPKDHLFMFGQWYKVGDTPGEITYHMDEGDLREFLRNIRLGKLYSDFMVVSLHTSHPSYAYQQYGFDHGVNDFLREFAHQAIDNGADVFVAHGPHTLRPIEIYKGKPIFYSLKEFYSQLPQSSLPGNPGGRAGVTEADQRFQPGSEMDRLNVPEFFEGLLVETRFENGRLAEVRLHPADLGMDKQRPFTRRGIPMIPSPEVARQILEKMQRISQPYGTKIAIENGIGIIRIGS